MSRMDCFVGKAAAEALKQAVAGLVKKIREFRDYEENLMELESLTNELKAKLEDVEDLCVRNWIGEIERAIVEAEPFITKEKPSKNPIRRYEDSKGLIKVLKKMHRLNDFYFSKMFADGKMPRPKPFVALSWYEDAFNQLIDSKYSVIAVEGSTGSVKSYFLNYVAGKLSKVYDSVLFIGQSIKCFADLQCEIGNKLNLVGLESWKSAITVEHKGSLINQSLLKMDCALIFEGVDYYIDFSLLGIHFKHRTKVIFGVSNTMVMKSMYVDLHIGVKDLEHPDSSLILCSSAGLPHEIFEDSPFLKQLGENCFGRPKLLHLVGLCMRGSEYNPDPWLKAGELLNSYKETNMVKNVIKKELTKLMLSEGTETVETVTEKREDYDSGVVLYAMLCHAENSPFVLFPWVEDYMKSHGFSFNAKDNTGEKGKEHVTEIEHVIEIEPDLVAGFTELLQKYKDTLIQEKKPQGDNEDNSDAEKENEQKSTKKSWKRFMKLKSNKKDGRPAADDK